jgi:hypothetical protein
MAIDTIAKISGAGFPTHSKKPFICRVEWDLVKRGGASRIAFPGWSLGTRKLSEILHYLKGVY